jgi:thiol-disulfide isomerase/thioredoxin
MTVQSEQPPRRKGRRKAVAVIVTLGMLAGIYGLVGVSRNAGDPMCRPALDVAKRIEPLARGEVAAVKPAEEARKLPVLAFRDEFGEPKTLADFHGRTVLLNLWATWCVPCRKEMPALDALEDKLGAEDFEVVSINIDTRDPGKPKAWLKDVGIARLAYYSDVNAKVFQDLKAVGKAIGMPTTLLVDPNGCEIASLAGPAEWASEDAVKLVNAALGK